MLQRVAGVVCLAGLLLGVGCSGGGDSLNTAKAGGTVKLDGQPVAGADVTFSPQGQVGRTAAGKTDAQGRFQLATTGTISGVVPGAYLVSISKQRTEGGLTSEESQAYFEKTGQAPPAPKVTDELPVKYKSPTTSDLKATVESGKTNDFTFELQK